ncbi:polyketide synthase PksD [Daldinia vernicosa]|uniref:polyketide synthase PksD n=1 Tax=Daldinia vernicosa TaxID=114800 RepID=UPI002007C0AA|nr:polyketide synthase PksD [Daldinia vernicosa]KAI0848452.1 polyketide synthase PksD [Daldinia vernicosa]
MEPIAITGFSFKLPQGAEDESSLWEILKTGRNVMTAWPESRANVEAFYSSDSTLKNVLKSKGAHFLREDPSAFDAPFFSITSKEASSMDPQQRLLLEAAYGALENAGVPLEKVAGTQMGVFSGSMTDDYSRILAKDPDEAPTTTATGSSMSILANRISWYFDLKGPSVQINTACSSSMIAMDLACQSLRSGQSSMALVTGSNVMLSPETSLYLSNMNFISPDGVSYSFDHRANGYGRGEGAIVLVLKNISDALKDGDMIRAVIRATGSNQDGYTPGLTQPSAASQEELVRSVYKSCNLGFESTRYVEAHGTGTQIGDSTEVKALTRVFRNSRSRKEPLYIGSVKANIGHLEGGSGLAGILKAILILEKGIIPPNPLFEKWNPKINAKLNNIDVPTSCIKWPSDGLRRISVNSFGFGGSNGHIILDDAYHTLQRLGENGNHNTLVIEKQTKGVGCGTNGNHVNGALSNGTAQNGERKEQTSPLTQPLQSNGKVNGVSSDNGLNLDHDQSKEGTVQKKLNSTLEVNGDVHPRTPESPSKYELLVWSAKDESALKRMIQQHTQYFEAHVFGSRSRLSQLGYTLASRRSMMTWRSFAIVNAEEKDSRASFSSSVCVRSSQDTGIAFIFTGQGAQYIKMGLDLLHYPVFRSAMLKASDILHGLGAQWSLLDEIHDGKRINDPDLSQPLCTALQLSLVQLLRSFGIIPAAVIGHSSGEIAAAYTVGALSFEAACKVAYHRGRLARRLATTTSARGSMMSVNLPEDKAHIYLEKVGLQADVHVACVNSPFNVTLSGHEESIHKLQGCLESEDIFARKLNTGVAYHSPAMDEIASEYISCLGRLEQRETGGGSVVMISSVTGEKIPRSILSDSQYWVDNLVSPVRFADALQYLVLVAPKMDGLRKISNYVEVGPHGALRRPTNDTLAEITDRKTFEYTAVLSKFESPLKTVLETAGRLFSRGYPVTITAANGQGSRNPPFLVDLPEYPFDHSHIYWHETRMSREWRLRGASPRNLLGVRATDWNPLEPRWRKMLSIEEIPWIADHVVGDVAFFPATGTLMMAIEAVKQMAHAHKTISGYLLKEAVFMSPIVVRPEAKTEVITQLRPLQHAYEKTSLRAEVRVFAVVDGYWNECLNAIIHTEYEEAPTEVDKGRETHATAQAFVQGYEHAKSVCTKAIIKQDFYKWHHEQGLRYGPAFMRAEDVFWDGEELGVARIDVASIDPFEGLVHPAMFDASCQVCFAAPSGGMSKSLPTIIPHRMQDTWISATGWQHPHTSQIRVFTTSKPKTLVPGLECSFTLLADDGSTLSHCKRLEMLPVVGNNSASENKIKLFHGVEWKPHLSLLSPSQLRNYCDANSVAEDDVSRIGDWEKLQRTLRADALSKLAQLQNTDWTKTPPHMKKYVSWLEKETQGLADDKFDDIDVATDFEDLQKTRPSWSMFIEIAENLVPIVKGEVDSRELLFSTTLAEGFFDEVRHKPEFASFMELLAHQTPDQKILEIGSSAGAMTSCILSMLWKIEERNGGIAFSEYVYTDASTTQLEKTRSQFAKEGRISFQSLDMEQDIATQGFELGIYDTILAGNVLHAAKNVTGTLRNLRRLLKPGGHLIMNEITASDIFAIDFGFGVLSSYWSDENATRPYCPTMTEPEWETVLQGNGFSGNDLVIRDSQNEGAHFNSVIISSAKDDSRHLVGGSKIVIAIDDQNEYQQNLAMSLESSLVDSSDGRPRVIPLPQIGNGDIRATDYVVFLADLYGSLLPETSEAIFKYTQKLVQQSSNLLWVTSAEAGEASIPARTGPYPYSGLKDGFLRTLRAEFTNKRIISLSIEDGAADTSDFIIRILNSTFGAASPEVEYIVRDGLLQTGRLVEDIALNEGLSSSTTPRSKTEPWLPGPPLKLDNASPGSLETLRLVEDKDFYADLGPTEVEIEAKVWGINFRDVFIALGRLEEDDFGTDCAGVVTKVGSQCKNIRPGDRVCMFVAGCMRMWPRSEEGAVVKISDSVSFNEACAVVNPGITAWYSLVEVARLQKGEKVLIHSASGATGQLAVQVAQLVGAEVFATVGFDHKKQLLMDTYGIPEDHILYSRNPGFAKGIMRLTNGYGVDVVLNSLVGESLRASWECIAPYGRFVEIGKADIKANTALPMACFAKNVSFSGVDLHHILIHRHDIGQRLLHKTMELAGNGSIRSPAPLHVYKISEIDKAFRYFQSGKNTGRVIIQIDRSTEVQKCLTRRRTWSFDSDSTYIVVGGLGGIGRLILKWMAKKGARNLIVPSRSGATSKPATSIITELTEQGVRISTPRCDVSVADSFSRALEEHRKTMPPIRGCINAAMVLNDSIFENLTHTQWEQTIRSKVQTSWNLHALLPEDLDFFILLSSISGIVGNPGQSNYAAGCTFQDSLARYRNSNNQRAISLDLGVVRAVGVVSETESLQKKFAGLQDFAQIEEDEILAVLDMCCDPEEQQFFSSDPGRSHIVMGVATPAELLARGIEPAEFTQRPLFARFSQSPGTPQNLGSDNVNYAALFRQSESTEERAAIVVKSLAKKLARALSIQPEEVEAEADQPLHAFGVDSLVAMELRNWVAKDFAADVAVFELMGGRSVTAIGELVTKASQTQVRKA